MRTAVLAATLASAALSHALSGQTTSAALRPIDIAADVKATLQREHDAVVNQTLPQGVRDEAASRLLSHHTAESRNLLLKSAVNAGARLAVARALKDDPAPDAESIGLLKSWLGTDDETTVAAAHALAEADKPDEALLALLAYINDRSVRESMRAAAARGLGASADIRAARTLGVLLDDDKYPIVKKAACDALVEMTGLTRNGRDTDAWKKWVQDDAGPGRKNPDFRDRLVDLLKRRQQPMPLETMDLLERLFQQIPPENKSLALNNMLTDPQPGARIVGIRLFEDDQTHAGRLSANLPLVIDMIGDSSAAVRQQVAKTLFNLNRKETAEALMTQLALETDPAVKAEIIHAVATGMSDIRIVPQLLQLLKDPSERVRVAAADGLRSLGAVIKVEAVLAKQVIGALEDFIGDKQNQGDMKAAGVEALVPLADKSMLDLFTNLSLDAHEAPATRRAALRGLEVLGDPHVVRQVMQVLTSDKDASVRLAALDTFLRVGSFGYNEALFRLTKPENEPDASVRARAWEVFQQLLSTPSASDAQLRDYAELFRKSANAAQDPHERDEQMNHRLAVLLVLADRDQKNGDAAHLADLAAQRENIGAAYVQLHQPEKAVPYFRQALDYWLQNNAKGEETLGLIRELMDALLDSKQYDKAAQFADATIARDPEQQRIVATRLVNRAEDLLNPPPPPPGQPANPASPRDALQLATEGLTKINAVALEKNYRLRLEKVQTDAAKRLAAAHSRPSP
jgi:tetratricopeptide (TPR) repeat protein